VRVGKQLWFWLSALVLLVAAVALLKEILLPFVAALVIAYFLNPLADRLQERGLSRLLAAAMIVGVAAILVVLALILLVPLLLEQVRQLVTVLPDEMQRFKRFAEGLARSWFGPSHPPLQVAIERLSGEVTENWTTYAGTLLTSVWSRGVALVNVLSLILITPVVVFYLLVDWHPMLERIDQAIPRDHVATVRRLAAEINDAVAAFIRGQGAICLILGIFYAAGLSWAGLNYSLLIGLMTGLLAFVPVVGWLLGLICTSAVAIVQFWPDLIPLAKAVGVLVAGIAIDTAFLSPRLVGKRIKLHPVWLIFALFVFSYLFGLVGTLIAVPLAAAVAVLVRFAIDVYLKSSVYQGAADVRDAARPSEGKA
jgi:predicted PurR-regulated permease PerM